MFLSAVVRYVCWQLTQTIEVLFKTFVRPVDTSIENFLGATEYAVNTTFLNFVTDLRIKQQLGTAHVWQ